MSSGEKVLFIFVILIATTVVSNSMWISFAPQMQDAEALIRSARMEAGLETKMVKIRGLRLSYTEGGFGDPLVLIHGSGDDKDSWIPVSRYLTRQYRVIALDLPGFGESDRPPRMHYNAKAQAKNVKAFTRALGLTSFHLGGHSLGGKISAIYAAKHPSEVKSLWLLAPSGVYSSQPSLMHKMLKQGYRIPIYGRTVKEFDKMLHFVMNKPTRVPGPVKKALVERAVADYDLHNMIYQQVQQEAFNLEDIADKLKMPTRIVWGDQDRVLHSSGAEILRKIAPQSSLLMLKGVGHAPMVEEPKRVAEDFTAFEQSAVN